MTTGGATKMIQGVRDVFEIVDVEGHGDDTQRGKLVLIGRGLAGLPVEESLQFALKEPRAGETDPHS